MLKPINYSLLVLVIGCNIQCRKAQHWLTNAMLHATNAMLHTTNAMLPATNAMLQATNAICTKVKTNKVKTNKAPPPTLVYCQYDEFMGFSTT